MEGFNYVDIFATKGLEYVEVLGFLLAFVIIWKLLQWPAKTEVGLGNARTYSAGTADWFRLEDERYYHPGHTWALAEDDRVVRVGMDDFAHKLLGAADAVRLPEVGAQLRQGGKGWQVEVRSKAFDVLSPIGGEVTEVNREIIERPDRIGEDPYHEGWFVKIRVPCETCDFKNLLSGRSARAWLDSTVATLRQHMDKNLGTLIQDGGLPLSGFAASLWPENWAEVAEEFLLTERNAPCTAEDQHV